LSLFHYLGKMSQAEAFFLKITAAQRQVLEKNIRFNGCQTDRMLFQKPRGRQFTSNDAVYEYPIFVCHKGKRMNFIYKVIGGLTDRLIGDIMDTFIGECRRL